MVSAMNQVQVAPLFGREVAEERRRMQLAGMCMESVEDLSEPGHGGGLVTAGRGQWFLRRRDARLHPPLFQDAAQHEPTEQNLEQPRHSESVTIERAVDE